MSAEADIVAYSPDQRAVLVVECKAVRDVTPSSAAHLRRNLLTHSLVADAPYLLIAYPRDLFMWKRDSQWDAPPDFTASLNSVLSEYLGKVAEEYTAVRAESLELALYSWLSDLASTIRKPSPNSDADQMLVRAGVYDQIKRGEVKSQVSP
jgi:hypothetical protein